MGKEKIDFLDPQTKKLRQTVTKQGAAEKS